MSANTVRAVALLACAACGSALQMQPLRPAVGLSRAAAPSMQFWKKSADEEKPSKPTKKASGNFYDDEADTVSRGSSKLEVAENGEVDLAAVGGIYYLAFIPFLLFIAAFASGLFSFGYEKGNF
uniref:Uncharacterized protein n=1 Tax=Chrysotila carterae TaxID=13221 RepID=A0A7S4C2F6_CHRCT|mmetsp:Transcript_28573/g.60025  ORF Transcript_28573/g.60025 Transcript_28573/m.60025 type:complete len:124 (+) Transcript_28573:35-406(+)|eukprot:6186214-Pleurochrysis_carterae.AAC.1